MIKCYILFILLIFSIFYRKSNIKFKYHNKYPIKIRLGKPKYFFLNETKDDLFIAVICQIPESPRPSSLLKSWGYEFSKRRGAILKIYTAFDEANESLIPKKFKRYVNIDISGFLFRLSYYLSYQSSHDFYEKTSLKWYLRTTYDVFVHVPNLMTFIRDLEQKFDPFKDIIVKADHNTKFLHGGSGWLMSRATVSHLLKMEPEMTARYKKEGCGDDVNIMHFLKKLKLNFSDVHSQQFSGWGVIDDSYMSLVSSGFNYSNITKPCSNMMHVSRVRDIAVWHNGRKKDYVNEIGRKIIDEAPSFLGIQYILHYGGIFC